MNLRDLATKWGVHAAALRNQIKRGALTGEKSGRDWFVSDEEAARYEREQLGKRGAASPRHPGTGGRPRKHPVAPQEDA